MERFRLVPAVVTGQFPPDAGRTLASLVLLGRRTGKLPGAIDTIDIVVKQQHAALLVASFYGGFFQYVFDTEPDLLEDARKIRWFCTFEFQDDLAAKYSRDFKPVEKI